MREARVFYFRREIGESSFSPLLLVDNVQPAKPFFFALIGPKGRVAGPELFNFSVRIPIQERRLNRAFQFRRQRKILLVDGRCDRRLLVIARVPNGPRPKFGGFRCMGGVRRLDQ